MANKSWLRLLIPERTLTVASARTRAFEVARNYGAQITSVNGGAKPIHEVRNKLSLYFMQRCKEQYALWIDDDTIIPRDCVERLIAVGKPIVAAACPMWLGAPCVNICAIDRDESQGRWPRLDIEGWPRGVVQCRHFGWGCVLMHRSVFDKMTWPLFGWIEKTSKQRHISEDEYACINARKAGFELWADCDVRCGHVKTVDLLEVFMPRPRPNQTTTECVEEPTSEPTSEPTNEPTSEPETANVS